MDAKSIIEKWYKILEIPSVYDEEFYVALNEFESGKYVFEEDGKKNFLTALYMCEKLSEQYKLKGISDDILYDTLSDIGRWLDIWSELKGKLYLGETSWLERHLNMKLFKLGRLQFAFGTSEYDIAEKKIKKGDNVIEIHIPAAGPLLKEECEKSLAMAKKFFEEFYPEYNYKYFTCHSWLMDSALKNILKADSNILEFQDMFEIFMPEESYSILKYIFKWDTTKESLKYCDVTSGFAQKVKEWVENNKKFYEAIGVIEA